MYRHKAAVPRSVRDSWHVLESEDFVARTTTTTPKTAESRRSSAPITIFSAFEETDARLASQGILPGHVAGVFTGSGGDHTSAYSRKLETELVKSQKGDSEALTSLGSVLDEVLESVDAATEMHQRARSNSRIQDWLGEQLELHTEKNRKCSREERERLKRLTEGIMRDLLGVDRSVLNILFRPWDPDDRESAKTAREIELRIWKRWIELARRDTASLQGTPISRTPTTSTPPPSRSQRTRGKTLEKIPWGVPEDAQDEAYWNETISLPMIFRYLKSRLSRKAPTTDAEEDLASLSERSQKYMKTTQSVSTQTQTTGTILGHDSTVHGGTLTRPALSRASRSTRRVVQDRSRSRTSRSSSFRTMSQTGTCSVASLRRSALGSNFWDLGSLGGASVHSREVGNWSVYA